MKKVISVLVIIALVLIIGVLGLQAHYMITHNFPASPASPTVEKPKINFDDIRK